mgnify:FL=1
MSSVKKGIERVAWFLPIANAIIGAAAGFLAVSLVGGALKIKFEAAAGTGLTVGSVLGIVLYITTWIFLLGRKERQDETR